MPSILKTRTIIKITGDDSVKFLQNLVTNDVSSGESIYAMMLSAQGRFLFDMFIIKIENGFLLDISSITKDIFLQKLGMYKINMRVVIEDLSADGKICYSGASSWVLTQGSTNNKWILGSSPEDNGLGCNDDVLYYKDPRYPKLGYRFITSDNGLDDNSYTEDKYKYAIPDGAVDLLYDKAMPQEYGAEELHAISYNKGCYVGQEVISRTKTQGQIRKKIYKITADDLLDHIEHGTEIISSGQKIGIFCSSYKNTGIALIREENIEEGVIPSVGNIEVKIEKAEWYEWAL